MSGSGRGEVVVAVDPGRDKCGIAVVAMDGRVEQLSIVQRPRLRDTILEITENFAVAALLVGDRTGSSDVLAEIQSLDVKPPPQTVPEHETTLRARERYFADNPPRGWKRLIPRGMILPPRPVDDFAALVMAEQWLAAEGPPE